ncbi:DoxX family protein [Solilutibacter silvestris]|uniref:DoxX family protein n=1 Tax=Solilutibacter silvestris TaxID=1645665 RepID=UPI00197C8729|nr:DoxX family protein [Lysobacter silvestris]
MAATTRLDWLAPLLLRLVFGYFWAETGWAKLVNHAGFAERFANWGVPFPDLSATLSGATDLVGGVLLMLGLMTRLTTLPMIFNMVIALALVVLPSISMLDDFVELNEVLYILVLFWLFMAGPGRASLDHLILKRMTRAG